jgi:hypothetical protein
MKKLSIGILSLAAVGFTGAVYLSMDQRANFRAMDNQIDTLISGVTEENGLTQDSDFNNNSKDTTRSSTSPISSTPYEDLDRLMDMYFDLEGVHTIAWANQLGIRHLRDWPVEMLEDMVPFMNKAQPFLSELRRVTERHDQLPVGEWYDSASDQRMFGAFENIARIVYVDASIWSAKGEPERPLDTIIAGIRLANSMVETATSFPWAYTEYQAAQTLLAFAVEELYPKGSLTHARLNRWLYETQNAYQRDQFLNAYQRELIGNIEKWKEEFKYRMSFDRLVADMRGSSVRGKVSAPMQWIANNTIRRNDWQARIKRKIEYAERAQTITAGPYYEIVSQMHYITRSMTAQAQFETRIDLVTLGLLIEDYFNVHGKFPDTLQDLNMPFDRALPKDPYTGEEYLYRADGASFTLYGRGHRRTDLEGKHNGQRSVYHIDTFNVVWRGENYFLDPDPNAPSDEVWEELLAVVQ